MDSQTTTLSELVYGIWNTLRAKTNITDTITYEQIKYHIKNVRAQLLKQDSNKGYTADPYIIQDLGCVELVLADASECCQVQSGCSVLRTKLQIPSTIELHHKQLFTRVGPTDKTKPSFDYLSYEKIPYIAFSRFTKNNVIAFQTGMNGYMYFIVPNEKLKLLKWVNIMGVFEDPEKVAIFNHCKTQSGCTDCGDDTDYGQPCYTEDSAFPIKSWMIPVITEIVLKQFLNQQGQAQTDANADGKLDITGQQEQQVQ